LTRPAWRISISVEKGLGLHICNTMQYICMHTHVCAELHTVCMYWSISQLLLQRQLKNFAFGGDCLRSSRGQQLGNVVHWGYVHQMDHPKKIGAFDKATVSPANITRGYQESWGDHRNLHARLEVSAVLANRFTSNWIVKVQYFVGKHASSCFIIFFW
jgi:hypothetical protein